MDPVRQQYERHPYPPVPFFALPLRHQGQTLRYEFGLSLARSRGVMPPARVSHEGGRLLVAGCGTLEALVVAQQHPLAQEVVACDLSRRSLQILKKRLMVAKIRNAFIPFVKGSRLPPVRLVRADLREWEGGLFDYILCNNMIHHVNDPASLLQRLAGFLKSRGLIRMVTYPKQSRLWMRKVAEWFRLQGVESNAAGLKSRAKKAIDRLPKEHPLKEFYRRHAEIGTEAGLVDAFFHARENPLSPLEWKDACERAGLVLVGESHCEEHQSGFLEKIHPDAGRLDSWEKLEVMDQLLLIKTNPVFWLVKVREGSLRDAPSFMEASPSEPSSGQEEFHRSILKDLGRGYQRAALLLGKAGIGLKEFQSRLRDHAGWQKGAEREPEVISSLEFIDHDLSRFSVSPLQR